MGVDFECKAVPASDAPLRFVDRSATITAIPTRYCLIATQVTSVYAMDVQPSRGCRAVFRFLSRGDGESGKLITNGRALAHSCMQSFNLCNLRQ